MKNIKIFRYILCIITLLTLPLCAMAHEHETKTHTSSRRQQFERYNLWLWGGTRFDFTYGSLRNFMGQSLLGIQVGVGKSFWDTSKSSFIYGALVFTYSNSHQRLGTQRIAPGYQAWYYYTNEEFLLGWEQNVWDCGHLSFFLEAGGVFQQSDFAIEPKDPCNNSGDYAASQIFGGSFNAGFNFVFYPKDKYSFLVRLGWNVRVFPTRGLFLTYNQRDFNATPMMYGPVVSIALRR